MLTTDAVAHYKTQKAIARALDISDAAVSKWPEVVPIESALALEIITARALRVDRSLYPSLARALDVADQRSGAQTAA
jgi:hypothetical protein